MRAEEITTAPGMARFDEKYRARSVLLRQPQLR